MRSWALGLLVLFCGATTLQAATDKVFCFYNAEAEYRNVAITDLKPRLCTHMVLQYNRLYPYGAVSTLDLPASSISKFVNLGKAAGAKILVSIGGPEQSSSVLSSLMSIVSLRKATVLSIATLVNDYGLDGIDFYWRYPVLAGGNPEDRENFVTFLSQLKAAMSGKLIAISVAPTKDFFLSSYDIAALSSYVDYVNVMAFDLRGYWDAKTGFNAPPYPSTAESSLDEAQLNVDSILRGWISAGLSSSKIILGVSTEGHSYKLSSTFATGLKARTIGPGNEGAYTGTLGVLNYLEVCELLKKGDWTVVWSNIQKAHYAYKGDQWVSYESLDSLGVKIALALQYNVAGIGMWAVDGDDVKNVCGGGPFTLLEFVSIRVLAPRETDEGTTAAWASSPGTTIAKTTTTSTTTTTTTTAAPTGLPAVCPSSGFVRDPYDCAKFYRCTAAAKFTILSVQTCGAGLYFDTRYNVCNWKASVPC